MMKRRKILLEINANDDHCATRKQACSSLRAHIVEGRAMEVRRCRLFDAPLGEVSLTIPSSELPQRIGACKHAELTASELTDPAPGETHCFDCGLTLQGCYPEFRRWVAVDEDELVLNHIDYDVADIEPPKMIAVLVCHSCRKNCTMNGWQKTGEA